MYVASIPGITILSGTWRVLDATIVSQNSTTVTINWTSTGKKTISYSARTNRGVIEGFYLVKVLDSSAPSAPTAPTISSQSCSSASLQRANPPSGVTWYWQGTNSNGTSMSNSNTTYTVSASGTYYLRARNTSGIWSAAIYEMIIQKAVPNKGIN